MYAEVILPLPMQQTYTYHVPDVFRDKIAIGKRVIVQFGQRKMYTGLVRSLHESPPGSGTVKEVFDILDEEALINDFQFRFWDWMADYYMCTQGEIFKAALPSGLKLESESRILVNDDYDGEPGEREALILRVAKENNGLSVGEMNRITGYGDIHNTLRHMMEEGAVFLEERLRERFRPRKVTYVRLSTKLSSETGIHEILDSLSRAPKQKEALNEILSKSVNGDGQIVSRDILLSDLKPMVDHSTINNLVRKGLVVKTGKPAGLASRDHEKTINPHPLNEAQKEAMDALEKGFVTKNVMLLHGVTSSGKTEIYIHLIKKYLEEGRQVLYLLPEIALTSQIVERLQRVFGDEVGVYHSKFSDSERVEVYMRLKNKGNQQYKLILGVRSAVFLPFDNLGLVIVDEEHENTFKQFDPAPRYHARDAAVVLASLHDARVLMGTATPAVETYTNAVGNKYGLVELTSRYGDVKMPEILIADVRKSRRKREMKSVFTPLLLDAIKDTISADKQVILFQNRRGYSSYLECNNCGWIPRCEKCDVSLTYHRYDGRLVCHYCGYSVAIPDHCGECHGTGMVTRGFGTELVEDEIAMQVPEARVARLDLDTSRSRNAYTRILEGFGSGKYNILVGTQMLSKGLDFENVALVGILNADQMLNFPDFRAYERSFQLMAQVSGRAGRKDVQGKVIIQATDPGHPVIRYVISNDYQALYRDQVMERQAFAYPPFVRIIKLVIRGKEKGNTDEASGILADRLRQIFGRRVLGPQPPLVGRVKNQFINQILLKVEKKSSFSKARGLLRQVLTDCDEIPACKKVRINIDVDPM